jgi:hypothetical protein
MFRISRIRIRWLEPDRRDADDSLAAQPLPALAGGWLRGLSSLNPRRWRVRLRWVGFGPVEGIPRDVPARQSESDAFPASARILRTFDLPNMRVRVGWLGFGSLRYRTLWTMLLLVTCVWLGLFALTRPAGEGQTGQNASLPQIDPEGLVVYEGSQGDSLFRMTHSRLDIGSSQDAFDSDLETLIRGRDANPFVIDFEFAQPQPITGIMIDSGRMDFVLRVQVFGAEDTEPVLYTNEYREQPPIPHVDLEFLTGPVPVRRIYIEIEQLNPPEEVHVHIREIVFKK